VRKIKDCELVRKNKFVHMLIIMLLLSTTMGTIVCTQGKPTRPGKPVETWDVKIWLEEPGEDVILLSPEYEGEDPAIYLLAEDVPCSGKLWEEPRKKGNYPNKNNYVAAQVDLIKDYEDDCGSYQLADAEGYDSNSQPSSLGDFPLENDYIDYVSIRHNVWPMGEGMDYWTFSIRWFLNPNPDEYVFYELSIWTDKDYEAEGILSEEEGWTVIFNEADAMLYSSWIDEDPNDGLPDNYHWMGSLSFTIRITRTLPQA
jgi:hypothetical protein